MSSDQVDRILEGFSRVTGSWSEETTLAQMREEIDGFFRAYDAVPGTRISAVDDPVAGEWVAAPGGANDKAILLLHGGGYILGSARAHRPYASHLSKAIGARVFSLDYRLAPEHLFPAAIDDAVCAYEMMLDEDLSPDGIAICGDSAGGGLAVALLVSLRDKNLPLPACALLVSPWADIACEGESYTENAAIDPIATTEGALGMGRSYVGEGGDPYHPLASPIRADLHGLPPILIQAGSREIFIDDCKTLKRRIGEAGGNVRMDIWPDMFHQFQLHVGSLDESEAAIGEIASFANEHFGPR